MSKSRILMLVAFIGAAVLVGLVGWTAYEQGVEDGKALKHFENVVQDKISMIDLPAFIDCPEYNLSSDEVFERESIEKLLEALQNSEGQIRFEKNALGIETWSVNISWEN